MYDTQHGVEANLFLAPGEGDEPAHVDQGPPDTEAPGAKTPGSRSLPDLGMLEP